MLFFCLLEDFDFIVFADLMLDFELSDKTDF